jgi:DNA polymerase-4
MNNKIVLHLDMNSYYATLEQQAYPNLRGKPVGIAGKGPGERTIIAGASVEAKKMGVKGVMSTWEARKICPELIIIPANYDRYIFTSKRIFALLERFSPKVEIFSIDEAFIELPGRLGYSGAEQIARQMKQLIKKQIGEWVTCSVGVSYGKTMAKLASELQKPDGLVTITPENFQEMAEKTNIENLCGIGFRLTPRLNRLGIKTVADLGRFPQETLTTVFGESLSNWLHSVGNGQDDNKIRSWRELPQEKSVGHNYTLPRDISSLEAVKDVLALLSERVGVRLRRKGLAARTIAIYLGFGDGTGWSDHLRSDSYLFDGYQLFEQIKKMTAHLGAVKPVRFIGVTTYDLMAQVNNTQPIFPEVRNYERLVEAIDKINNRYGELVMSRGNIIGLKKRIFSLPDGRNKRSYVPNATPFMKRV